MIFGTLERVILRKNVCIHCFTAGGSLALLRECAHEDLHKDFHARIKIHTGSFERMSSAETRRQWRTPAHVSNRLSNLPRQPTKIYSRVLKHLTTRTCRKEHKTISAIKAANICFLKRDWKWKKVRSIKAMAHCQEITQRNLVKRWGVIWLSFPVRNTRILYWRGFGFKFIFVLTTKCGWVFRNFHL